MYITGRQPIWLSTSSIVEWVLFGWVSYPTHEPKSLKPLQIMEILLYPSIIQRNSNRAISITQSDIKIEITIIK
jgi:hypothetical protein